MQRAFSISVVLVSLVSGSCKTDEKRKPPPTPAGPPAVASCDYRAETLDGNHHSCREIFDPTAIELHAAACNELRGPRDHPTFQRGRGCPVEGRKGGCLYPNGMIEWQYEGKRSCKGGKEFSDVPTIEKAAPYRCMSTTATKLCIEIMSVFDMTKTLRHGGCAAIDAAVEPGSCPADNVVGRCATREVWQDATWVMYPPMTTEMAKQHCEQTMPGTFTPP